MTLAISRHSEFAFETVIEAHLLANGYRSITSGYDISRALYPDEALAFIRQTQPKSWTKLEAILGNNLHEQIISDLCKAMDSQGVLTVLRHGFKCYGNTLRIAIFKSAHTLNTELEANYKENRVAVVRQLHYSDKHRNSLDMVIIVNGIPIVTIELKNPMTGQTYKNAIAQYKNDRDPRENIFQFKKRTLVHFAVDTQEAWMTTRLTGSATHFLPFNRGYENGAGNPPREDDYRTAYLWEEVLQRDSLLDLLAHFLHLQKDQRRDESGKPYDREVMIFPRYHQLQAVRMLTRDAREKGVGHNYLIEHSAGSGKSNTIGWLAHRLSTLHNANNERIFDSVIVITDRRVLDRQLQDTVYQFEHKHGVIQKIDEDSQQLLKALESSVPIIITTLQKFPFVTRHLVKRAEEQGTGDYALETRHVAVIVDEAHSSQSGESSVELKGVLGGKELIESAEQKAIEDGAKSLRELYRSAESRKQQSNISFFAFTATPKNKTLEIFAKENDNRPFHRYTMRQAIEERFIMDVLLNYVSYKAFYRLVKSGEDDPNVERKDAVKALSRFMRLHPHNIAQKTEIMVEHFYTFTRHKIGGRAKAMVVTDSRLAAVRYKQSFDEYIRRRGYPIKTLVAFSGTVQDDKVKNKQYTEEGMNNGVRESEVPELFASGEYQVLLVAEKYQTGFDQPLLHTMYIDRRLAGIQAVQTLSRLNRIHPYKEDTFVLDFVNDPQEIHDAFKQFYEGAEIGTRADPAQLYQIKAELDGSGIYLSTEMEAFCEVYFAPKQRQSAKDHKLMNVSLEQAVERFKRLHEASPEDAELWRGKLYSFRNLYAFLSQIIPYQDTDLEKTYVFLRHLASVLPRRSHLHYDFDDEVKLEYYRIQKISEGSIDLSEGEAKKLDGPTEVGTGDGKEHKVPLSTIVKTLNDRFGTDFNEADQLFFEQLIASATLNEELREFAEQNPEDKFKLIFDGLLKDLMLDRLEMNESIVARYMGDADFKRDVAEMINREVYSRLKRL